jgi:D-alanyl-D-alanine endopeptidase (penicillin-binding protein 7)
MNQDRWIKLTAVLCLFLAAAVSHAATPRDGVVQTHLKYSRRAALAEPALRSSAALVLDTTHSAVLYSRRSSVALPIDEPVVITAEDRRSRTSAPSRLLPGTQLTRGDLMHLALMSSENRAAHALGRTYPGGIEACVEAMNAKARELGMTSARFVEPTGLSDANVASPEDLSKLVMAAAQVPAIREYSTDGAYPVQVGRRTLTFHNTDSLVRRPEWNIVVQKTGYISRAGRCLVMQAVIEDRTVVIVLLNSFGKHTRVADARRIRKWMEATLPTRDAATVTAST